MDVYFLIFNYVDVPNCTGIVHYCSKFGTFIYDEDKFIITHKRL